jgi:GNAT superfamily N-acetyltransferase
MRGQRGRGRGDRARSKANREPELVQIVEAGDEPIGFCIALPDIMQLLQGCNGRLLPKAWYRLLFKLQSIRIFRIWALGIVPEFQRRGIDTLLYSRIWEVLKDVDAVVEANYILEDNFPMKDAVLKLGIEKIAPCGFSKKISRLFASRIALTAIA